MVFEGVIFLRLKINKNLAITMLGFVGGIIMFYSLNSLEINKVYGSDTEVKMAIKNSFPVRVNGDIKEYDSYAIDGYTYFKLRDLAEFTPINVYWRGDFVGTPNIPVTNDQRVIDIFVGSFIEIIQSEDGEPTVGLSYFYERYKKDGENSIYEQLENNGKHLPYVYNNSIVPNCIEKYDGTNYVKDFECQLIGTDRGGMVMGYDDFIETLYPKFAEIIKVNEAYIDDNLE